MIPSVQSLRTYPSFFSMSLKQSKQTDFLFRGFRFPQVLQSPMGNTVMVQSDKFASTWRFDSTAGPNMSAWGGWSSLELFRRQVELGANLIHDFYKGKYRANQYDHENHLVYHTHDIGWDLRLQVWNELPAKDWESTKIERHGNGSPVFSNLRSEMLPHFISNVDSCGRQERIQDTREIARDISIWHGCTMA